MLYAHYFEHVDKEADVHTNEIADSLFGKANVINNILLLPDTALNDSIFGIINVPIIKYSVNWWNTLHQPASVNIMSESTIHSSMLF